MEKVSVRIEMWRRGWLTWLGCWAVGPGKWAMVFSSIWLGQHTPRGGDKKALVVNNNFNRNIYRKVTCACMLVEKSYERVYCT